MAVRTETRVQLLLNQPFIVFPSPLVSSERAIADRLGNHQSKERHAAYVHLEVVETPQTICITSLQL